MLWIRYSKAVLRVTWKHYRMLWKLGWRDWRALRRSFRWARQEVRITTDGTIVVLPF